MKIKEQTRKLVGGCSKHCFEVVDKTDEVSYVYTWSEEIFEEYKIDFYKNNYIKADPEA